jgi:hypothetical protein
LICQPKAYLKILQSELIIIGSALLRAKGITGQALSRPSGPGLLYYLEIALEAFTHISKCV